MTNRNGRGRLNRGRSCDETARGDRIGRRSRGRHNDGKYNPRGELRPRYRREKKDEK